MQRKWYASAWKASRIYNASRYGFVLKYKYLLYGITSNTETKIIEFHFVGKHVGNHTRHTKREKKEIKKRHSSPCVILPSKVTYQGDNGAFWQAFASGLLASGEQTCVTITLLTVLGFIETPRNWSQFQIFSANQKRIERRQSLFTSALSLSPISIRRRRRHTKEQRYLIRENQSLAPRSESNPPNL